MANIIKRETTPNKPRYSIDHLDGLASYKTKDNMPYVMKINIVLIHEIFNIFCNSSLFIDVPLIVIVILMSLQSIYHQR